MKTTITLSAILAALAFSACKESATTATSEQAIAPDPVLERFFTDEPIADARQITAVRATVKPGDGITLTGLVMGRTKVFVDGRASFVLGDRTTLTPCSDMGEDDHCPTPWDACCDSKEDLLNGIASIQIVGEDGRVLSGNIKGTKGLKELSKVTVTGTVAEQSTADSLIVNATKIHVGEP
ncbi:hypothetical protein HZ994_12945 [Akkermansiaceae bacterium]|nr:hypothetical protein HZ994_12945 [Akkermansiaceae bacterium]